MGQIENADPRARLLFGEQRFLLYFDFLGFSDIVKRKFLHQVISAFQTSIKNAHQIISNYKKIATNSGVIEPVHGHFWFSDTLILYSKDNSPKNLVPLTALAAYLTAAFLDDGFPTRSVINFGEFYVGKGSEGQELFLGNALIEAFEFEKTQNWCGGALHPSVWAEEPSFLNETAQLERDNLLINYEAPLKTGKIYSHKCFCWPKFYRENFAKGLLNIRKDMVRRSGSPFPWEVEYKIRQTETFYENVSN